MIKRFRQWRAKRKLAKLIEGMILQVQREGLTVEQASEVVRDLINAKLAGMDNEFVEALARARIVEKRGGRPRSPN